MPIEILMPALSPTMEDGTLAKWLVSEGDSVAAGDLLAEIETDKATMEFEAVDDGIIAQLLVSEGTGSVKVNTPIALLAQEGETKDLSPPVAQPDAVVREGDRVFASPLARRLAVEKGLDLTQISGSGPQGRIVKADVVSEVSVLVQPLKAHSSPSLPAMDVTEITKLYADRDYTEIALDGMRKTIAARLSQAKQTIPHFYLRRDINLDALTEFRTALNVQLQKRAIKLSINDFIIKACALALQDVPAANAVWAGDRILQLAPSDVAVAVAIEGGLFTPVLKDAEQKGLTQLSAEMKDLAARARSRKLAPHEYQGGSFAISNLGMMGIDSFDAVINPPHSAILAVGTASRKPVVTDAGSLGIATVMTATLSVDHRVIDGALGAELLAAIKHHLENPMAMLA